MNNQQHNMMSSGVTGMSQGNGMQHQRVGQSLNLQNVAFNNQMQQQPQMSHYQTQPMMVNTGFHNMSKLGQGASDVTSVGHQFINSNGAQNGTHHSLGGSSSVDTQNIQHGLSQTHQYHHSHMQYQQQQQHLQQTHSQYQQQAKAPQRQDHHQNHQHHQYSQHMPQQQLYNQGMHNNNQQPQQQSAPQSVHQSNTTYHHHQQQHVNVQHQLDQRHHRQSHHHHSNRHYNSNHTKHQHQQQYNLQPKQILQKPHSAKVGGGSGGLPAAAATATSPKQQPQVIHEPPLVIDTFSADDNKQDGSGADHAQDEEKSPNLEDTKSNGTSEASDESSLANTKEKTPMCLINELARFNKISHQYTLVDEQGPAHKKIFYVKLKLGNEEYSASGESIKKAQHAAAAIALVETGHPHPPPKPPRNNANAICPTDENITPTVELNALAMKRGEATTYKAIEPQQPPYYPQPGMDPRSLYNQRYHQFMRATRDPRYRGGGVLWPLRYHYPRVNRAFYVSLRVGHREFIGDGPTRQAARHNAAQKALRILKNLPVPNEPKEVAAQPEGAEQAAAEETPGAEPVNDGLKSEISLVHEVALRRNMLVTFEVIRETGPPHMKTFVTRCTVSEHVTEGEGNSKKTSKKKAAELMLDELKKLPPAPASAVVARPKCKVQINKKKNRNIIKSELQQQKADPNYGVGINPISRLIQIMQAKKKKEPVYTLVSERGLPRRREFVMQVEVEDKVCTGTGPNKKLAKRAAAEAMLLLLGYTKPSPQPVKSSIKSAASSGDGHSNGDKKVHFVGDNPKEDKTQSVPQQRVPGLLHLPPGSAGRSTVTSAASSSGGQAQPREPLVNLASILKPSLRPEIQLRELCKAMDMQLEIDDFTKKRPTGTEHITRITVGKEPGQSFHGSSNTMESSRDSAALDALKVLLGKVKELHPGGDGPQIRKELLTRSSQSLKKETK